MPETGSLLLRWHVWLVASVMPLLVRLLPLPKLLSLLTPSPRRRPYKGASADCVARTVAGRLVSPRNMRRRACLREGLVLFHFLRLAGHHAALHFAVYPPDRADSQIHAHCWVTINGTPISAPAKGPHVEMLRHGERAGNKL